MKFFKLIARGIDVAPLVQEISDHPHVWSLDTGRQDKVIVQRETNTIAIRAMSDQYSLDEKARRHKPFRYVGGVTSTSLLLPQTSELVDKLAGKMTSVLGRAVVVRLNPGGHVYRHSDTGIYNELRHRYHVVLKSVEGSRFLCGDEEVRMREGELWWFANKSPHEAINDSEEDRIHLIFDVLSAQSVASTLIRLIRSPKHYFHLAGPRIGRSVRSLLRW